MDSRSRKDHVPGTLGFVGTLGVCPRNFQRQLAIQAGLDASPPLASFEGKRSPG
jgi:hypothetical protein